MKKQNSLPKPVRKTVTKTSRDIADWKRAQSYAQRAESPKFYLLQDIYDTVADDALLTSQVNNRHERTVATPFELVSPDGKVDDRLTEQLKGIAPVPDIIKAMLDSELYGCSLVELSNPNGIPEIYIVPRQNLDPVCGRFYPDQYLNSFIPYRETAEYGKWILEFNSGHLGLLNKTVPHILFKKFAQSCWSELCEIYGIPPRYVKTNTQDEQMLARAEQMLSDMGAAAAFVIDTNEEFQFAQGVSTNGDVYANLIRLCNNEVSMLISGAIIGQDTENGNYSKEQSSIGMLDRLIESDRRMVETYMNAVVVPAFTAIGWLPQNSCRFRFAAVEDPEHTWQLVKDILPYKDVDNDWLTEKFGIPVKDKQLSLESGLAAGTDRFFV
jgi:phage gp29-like protein